MIFLSSLLNSPVLDRTQQRIGTLQDICITLHETFPVVTALVVSSGLGSSRSIIVPWSQVDNIEDTPVSLSVVANEIQSYEPGSEELLLRRDILDKQIVDTQGFRVVKVNDLKLAQIKCTARLVGVDISFSGILRRLGLMSAVNALGRVLPVQLQERTVTWNYVEPIQVVQTGVTGQLALAGAGVGGNVGVSGIIPQVQLNVSHSKLADLRPADIADILEQLDLENAGAMLERLDSETAADTLNELEDPRQSELLSELEPARASQLLQQLAPDDAADILSDLSPQEADRLLNLMPAAAAQPVRDLLRYESNTAGGIMTNEVLALSQQATVADALVYLRQHADHFELVYYLYITDGERHLKGVVSLRQLVTADPETQLGELMDPDVITVRVDTDQEEVARLIARYDLLAIPVLDVEERLCGIITVDDVIDVIHEEQAEDYSEMAGADVEEREEEERFSLRVGLQRFSWHAINAFAGFILAFVLYQTLRRLLVPESALAMIEGAIPTTASNLVLSAVVCLLPMALLTSRSMGSQALAIVGWELRERRGRDLWNVLMREMLRSTAGGILTSLLIFLLAWILFGNLLLSVVMGVAIGLALLVSALAGMILPNVLFRLHLRGSWITTPLLDPVIAVASLSTFLIITMTMITRIHL